MWKKLVAWMRLDGPGAKPLENQPKTSPLAESPFAPNPGNLRMFQYLPSGAGDGAALVVVLHGCGQTAQGYDLGAGWCRLAEQLGFAVLAPEQKAVNNPHTCFDWFNPEDITRGEGEAASIAAMVAAMLETHRLDARRVFIAGLSAGGSMAAVMLATYPELFAGGAIIAGVPYGAAHDVRDALESMRGAPLHTPEQWGDMVRAASSYVGPWPKISIWHGGLDNVVNISNAQASLAQWSDVHGLSLTAARQEMVDGAVRLNWDDRLEVYTLPLLGHGMPIASQDVGEPGPFMLEAGISCARRIAAFWGLGQKPRAVLKPVSVASVLPAIEAALVPRLAEAPAEPQMENLVLRALKALGLIKR
ncbi:MAG TPA: PHB depolymerase family esterase [Rhizomicrobium sp.]|nr:PHB depolymerase family esterase [Rhizomicrobium sp.]